MDLPGMILLLRRACDKAGGRSAWAAANHVSVQYVGDVLSRHRSPGEKILAALDLERVVTYRWIGSGKRVPDMIEVLRDACDKAGGRSAWGAHHHVSVQYIADVLGRRREPGEKILSALDVERVVTYRIRTGQQPAVPPVVRRRKTA